MQYLVFLRGINVGGKALIKMAELKAALEADGFNAVKTYIQSGNVFVDTAQTDPVKVARAVSKSIAKHFTHDVKVVAFTKAQWQKVVAGAPSWWDGDKTQGWKHDLFILLPPFNMQKVLQDLGEPKPDIEHIGGGAGVVYASLEVAKWGRTRVSRLAGTPLYKQMTIRNYNTSTKLLALFD